LDAIGVREGTVENDTFAFIVPGTSNFGFSAVNGSIFGGAGTDTVAISGTSYPGYSVRFDSAAFHSIDLHPSL